MGMPIPEEWGGAGGDTLSYAIAVEELARIDSSVAITVAAHTRSARCRSCSSAREEQSRSGCPISRPGESSQPSASPSRARARTRARPGRRARAARRRVGDQRLEDVHHERGHGHHRLRDDHRRHRRRRDLEHHRPERHPRLRDLGADAEDGLAGVRHAGALVPGLRVPEANLLGPRGEGLPPVPRDPRRRPHLGRRDGRRPRAGRFDLAAAYAQGAGAVRSADREVPGGAVRSSPTWPRDRRRAAASSTRPRGSRTRAEPFAQEAAMAKLYTGEVSNRVVELALQIHGGYGFMDEFAISRLYRDQKILEIGEGTNEVQRMVIAKHSACRPRELRSRAALVASAAMFLRQFVDDDLGCASYLIGDEEAGEAVVVDPAFAIEPFLAEAEREGRADRARPRDAHARRPRLRPRPARARARSARRGPPRRGRRLPERAARGRGRDRGRQRRGPHAAHARPPPGALLLPRRRRRAADRRLAVRRRRRAAGPRRRAHARAPRASSTASTGSLELPDDVAVSRARRGLALRRRHERRARVDDRAGAPLQCRARPRHASRSSSPTRVPSHAAAAEHGAHRRRSTAGRSSGLRRRSSRCTATARLVLDVRDADAFAAGHVKGAVSVPVVGVVVRDEGRLLPPPDRARSRSTPTSPAQARPPRPRLHAVGFFDLAGYLVEPRRHRGGWSRWRSTSSSGSSRRGSRGSDRRA